MAQQSGLFIANKGSYLNIPVPSKGNITYFLNSNDGDSLYGMKSDRSVFPVFTNTKASGEGVGNVELFVSGSNRLTPPTNSVVTYSLNTIAYSVTEDVIMTIQSELTVKNLAGSTTLDVVSNSFNGDVNMQGNLIDGVQIIGNSLSLQYNTTGAAPGNTVKWFTTIERTTLSI